MTNLIYINKTTRQYFFRKDDPEIQGSYIGLFDNKGKEIKLSLQQLTEHYDEILPIDETGESNINHLVGYLTYYEINIRDPKLFTYLTAVSKSNLVFIVKHIKTGNLYRVQEIMLNCDNSKFEDYTVKYQLLNHFPAGVSFCRGILEFGEKFTIED